MYDNIIVVVKLLSAAKDVLQDENSRYYIAELSLQAGEKSMSMTAFKQAFHYSCNGIQFLCHTSCWDAQYDLSLKLYDLSAKAAYCVAEYTRMNEFIDEISSNVTRTIDLVQPLNLRIRYFNARRMYKDAIDVAAGMIEKIDKDVNRILFHENSQLKPTASDIGNVRLLILNKTVDSVLEIGTMNDENASAIMLVLKSIITSAFFYNRHLMFFVSCKFLCRIIYYF